MERERRPNPAASCVFELAYCMGTSVIPGLTAIRLIAQNSFYRLTHGLDASAPHSDGLILSTILAEGLRAGILCNLTAHFTHEFLIAYVGIGFGMYLIGLLSSIDTHKDQSR